MWGAGQRQPSGSSNASGADIAPQRDQWVFLSYCASSELSQVIILASNPQAKDYGQLVRRPVPVLLTFGSRFCKGSSISLERRIPKQDAFCYEFGLEKWWAIQCCPIADNRWVQHERAVRESNKRLLRLRCIWLCRCRGFDDGTTRDVCRRRL